MERQFVLACAGARMSYEEICKVIGAGRNEDGKPIAKTTLIRNFKNELANGRAMLRSRVIGKFYQALDNNEPWAIQMGLRNQFGWDAGGTASQPTQLHRTTDRESRSRSNSSCQHKGPMIRWMRHRHCAT
jgi:hypothetical protein